MSKAMISEKLRWKNNVKTFLSLLDFIFVVGDKRNFDNFDWRKKCDRALEYNMSVLSILYIWST